MALPTSDLPGHRQLHERVCAALGRCQESQDIEFKESASWETLRWKVTRTALGMGNLRDGGIVVVGVSERGTTWELTGVEPAHLQTFDADTIVDQINAHVSPYVDVDVVLVEYEGRRFIAVYVREFRDSPLVCKKNGPDGEGIQKGCLYIRPPGKAEATKITDANEMHELLELAAEKRARRILEVVRRIGMVETQAEADARRFEQELEGL